MPCFNGNYTIIGKVLKGMDILNLISSAYGKRDGSLEKEIRIGNCGIYTYNDYIKDNKVKL